MTKKTKIELPNKIINARDHMANERTFLAWIRTSIGIMAFGFVVEKFSLFTKEIASYLGKSYPPKFSNISNSLQGYSSYFGIFLVALGALICILAFIKFRNNENRIANDTYEPSMLLDVLITSAVVIIGIFLAIYLIGSM